MSGLFELSLIMAFAAVFLIVVGLGMPKTTSKGMAFTQLREFRPRTLGKNKLFEGMADSGVKRALQKDSTNNLYLRWLKQANWYWVPGEPGMPNPSAPFWNLETMWGEKMLGATLYGGMVLAAGLLLGIIGALFFEVSILVAALGSFVFAGIIGMVMYGTPDSAVSAAAAKRQRELALEMGFRIPELRADVLAGNTIQRAMRAMSKRPGGPFVEELKRAVTVLDITRDDIQAMDQMMDRNEGNELLTEFCNAVKMVSRQGGQIGPVLNVLADLAQQRLRLMITSQSKRNLADMQRPIGISNMILLTLLIIAPALITAIAGFGSGAASGI